MNRTCHFGNWQHGGRLFGGFWMSMKREDRPHCIRINGEPIQEVDYAYLYPTLAYVRAQADLPEGDLYDVIGDHSSRAGWKMLINAMLFAQKALGNWPKNSRQHFPKGMSFKEATGLVRKKHKAIAHLFGAGQGFHFMRLESDILIAVIGHLFRNGVTALALHDAVLVAQSRAQFAKEAMEQELAYRAPGRRASVKINVRPI